MAPFELRQLRYAVIAAESPSFRQAAQALRVRQTTLSKRILLLEQRLGVPLFERTKRGAVPTPAGIEFARTARRILDDIDLLTSNARSVAKGEAGRLAIGLSTALSMGNLRAILQDFFKRFPDVELRVVEAGFDALTRGLASRTIDVAVVPIMLHGDKLSRRHLWPERLMVALPDDHSLAKAERIYWQDLRHETFIFTQSDPGPHASELLRARLRDPGQPPNNIIMHDVSRENLLNLVPMGRYATLLAETAIDMRYPGVVFRELHDATGLSHVDFWASWREDNDNPALQRFFRVIGERHAAFTTV